MEEHAQEPTPSQDDSLVTKVSGTRPIDSEEKRLDTQAPDKGVRPRVGMRNSLKLVFSWHNYRVYLLTAWVFSAFTSIWSFFNLYLLAIGWQFLTIGAASTFVGALAAVSRLVGGYVGDSFDRKKLSVIAMMMAAVYHIIIGLFTDFTLILVGLTILATMDIAKGGSSAYIMENIPKDDSGLALSLFTAGRSLGIIVLIVFGALVPVVGFGNGMRLMYLVTGVSLLLCTLVRQRYLSSSKKRQRPTGVSLWQDFLRENRHAARLLLSVMPGVLLVVIVDAFSDAIFQFGALLYAKEYLGVSISGITVIVLVPLIVSVPLLVKVGRVSDRRGVRRAALGVYSVMPVCAALLMLAPVFPYWMPAPIIEMSETAMTGLAVVFSTPFLAIVMKDVNDALWGLVLITLIQKKLPIQDTAKILAVFWFVVYLFASIGPFLGGLVFTYAQPSQLFAIVLVLNLIILGMITKVGLVAANAEEVPSTC